MARNMVIDGDYKGKIIKAYNDRKRKREEPVRFNRTGDI